jgi:hypothetical protein
MITVTYKDKQGEEKILVLGEDGWSGDDDKIVEALNGWFDDWIGISAYYPTAWHVAKAVANKLGGSVDMPEPPYETGEPGGTKVF